VLGKEVGVPQDRTEEVDQGEFEGLGVSKGIRRAATYHRKAADQNKEGAQAAYERCTNAMKEDQPRKGHCARSTR
jgi:hypothetical protein